LEVKLQGAANARHRFAWKAKLCPNDSLLSVQAKLCPNDSLLSVLCLCAQCEVKLWGKANARLALHLESEVCLNDSLLSVLCLCAECEVKLWGEANARLASLGKRSYALAVLLSFFFLLFVL